MPKVLVIDDSVSVRKVVERALAGRQVDVTCAASGTDALECMERDAPDVIICDVVMPDRDGYEICEFVKKHPRLGEIPVLLMSGIVNDEVKQRAARARSEGVLAKPFAAEDLLKRLETLVGPLAPRVADATTPNAPAPSPAVDAIPTLMPVSTLSVPPIEPLKSTPPKPAPAVPAVAADITPSDSARRVAEPVAIAPTSAVAAPTDAAAAVLAQFTAMNGVQWAVLSDREGFVVEATTNAGVDADVAAALSACLAESSDGLGKELGRGGLHSIMLEYEKGMVIVYSAGLGLLAVGMSEPAVLGKVRYFAKKALPELMRSV